MQGLGAIGGLLVPLPAKEDAPGSDDERRPQLDIIDHFSHGGKAIGDRSGMSRRSKHGACSDNGSSIKAATRGDEATHCADNVVFHGVLFWFGPLFAGIGVSGLNGPRNLDGAEKEGNQEHRMTGSEDDQEKRGDWFG